MTTRRTFAGIAIAGIALAVAMPVSAQQQQIPAPTIFSIRGGETLHLRLLGAFTAECVNQFVEFDGFDMMEGPPEVSLKFEPGKNTMNTVAGKVCPKPMPGGEIKITATDIADSKEANLTFRVRYKATYNKNVTWTYRYHLLMYPGTAVSNSK